jgi:hypothetical protein
VLKPNFAFSPALVAHLPAPFGRQPHAHADHRLDADFFRHGENLEELFEFLDDEDHLLPELAPEQRVLHEGRVLVAVANDQRFRVVVHRERREQFRFAARFDAEVIRAARVHDLLHDLAQLVHLDWKDAAIAVAILVLIDRRLEGFVDRLDAMPQQVLKAQHHRKAEPVLAARLGDQLHDVDGRRGFCVGKTCTLPRSLIAK